MKVVEDLKEGDIVRDGRINLLREFPTRYSQAALVNRRPRIFLSSFVGKSKFTLVIEEFDCDIESMLNLSSSGGGGKSYA